jgi:hypothetical protein
VLGNSFVSLDETTPTIAVNAAEETEALDQIAKGAAETADDVSARVASDNAQYFAFREQTDSSAMLAIQGSADEQNASLARSMAALSRLPPINYPVDEVPAPAAAGSPPAWSLSPEVIQKGIAAMQGQPTPGWASRASNSAVDTSSTGAAGSRSAGSLIPLLGIARVAGAAEAAEGSAVAAGVLTFDEGASVFGPPGWAVAGVVTAGAVAIGVGIYAIDKLNDYFSSQYSPLPPNLFNPNNGPISTGPLVLPADSGLWVQKTETVPVQVPEVSAPTTTPINNQAGATTLETPQVTDQTPTTMVASNLIPKFVENLPQITAKSTESQEWGTSAGKVTIENGQVLVDSTPANGPFDYAITQGGELKLGIGHYFLSGNANVVGGAGGAWFENGKFMDINDETGHYQPTLDEMLQTADVLERNGLTGDKFSVHQTY